MKPEGIEASKAKRKREAVRGVVSFILVQILYALAMLWVWSQVEAGWLDILLLVLAALDILTIPPSLIVLRERMKEIEGGELDAAAKY